jgi:hypothetical protein
MGALTAVAAAATVTPIHSAVAAWPSVAPLASFASRSRSEGNSGSRSLIGAHSFGPATAAAAAAATTTTGGTATNTCTGDADAASATVACHGNGRDIVLILDHDRFVAPRTRKAAIAAVAGTVPGISVGPIAARLPWPGVRDRGTLTSRAALATGAPRPSETADDHNCKPN